MSTNDFPLVLGYHQFPVNLLCNPFFHDQKTFFLSNNASKRGIIIPILSTNYFPLMSGYHQFPVDLLCNPFLHDLKSLFLSLRNRPLPQSCSRWRGPTRKPPLSPPQSPPPLPPPPPPPRTTTTTTGAQYSGVSLNFSHVSNFFFISTHRLRTNRCRSQKKTV